MKNSIIIKKICFVAMFATISSLLYVFPKFSLAFVFPKFLEINFSMLPIFIAAFMLGPTEAFFVVLLRFLVNILTEGTETKYVGEITDLILGSATVFAAGLPYKYLKGNKRTLFAFVFGILGWVLAGGFANYFYCVPQYLSIFFGNNKEAFVGACSIIPGINSSNYMEKYILFAAIPFNLLIAVVVGFVTFLVHKRLELLYDNFLYKKKEED